MVLEELAKGMLKFVDWIVYILIIMLIWEIFRFIAGGEGKAGEKLGAVGAAGGKLGGWLKDKGVVPFTEERKEKKEKEVKKAKKKTLKEIADDKGEYECLDEICEEIAGIKGTVSKMPQVSVGNINNDNKKEAVKVVKQLFKLQKRINHTKKKWNKVSRDTFKQQTEVRKLIEYLKEIEVDRGDLEELSIEENLILKKHKQTENKLNELKEEIDRLCSKLEGVKKKKWEGITEGEYGSLQGLKLDIAEKNAKEARKLQSNTGSGTGRGVLKILANIYTLIEKYI